MADSRLTDLPNLTTPNSDDVLYIVDVTRDSSNKITYANLVTNTIDSLSAYLDSIDIPSINGLVTDVATLSVTQLTKANQADLNATNNSLNTLESNVAVYAGYITKNTGDIVALSGYIDTKALNSDLNATNTRVGEISGTLSTKASQDEVDSKASQDDVNVLETNVNVISSNVSNIVEDLSSTNDDLDIVRENVTSSQLNIINNSLLIDTLSTTKAEQTLLNELSAKVIENEDSLSNIVFEFPFNISVSTGMSYLTSFYSITSPVSSYPVINNGTTMVVSTLSSSDGNIGNWNGLLVNTYVLSSEAIQVSIYNPTASTITTTNTNIILTITDLVN